MAYLFGEGKFQAFNSVGAPLAGGKLYSYTAGTTTPLATYTTQTGGVANANPVILDAYGRAQVWLGSGYYRMILKDASDVTVWDVDNISSGIPVADLASTSDTARGDALVGVKREASGAFATTVHEWIESQVLNVKEFGAVGDGVTDDSSAFAAAYRAALEYFGISITAATLYVPPGDYLLTTNNFLGSPDFDTLTGGYNAKYMLSIIGAGWSSNIIFKPTSSSDVWMYDNGTASSSDNRLVYPSFRDIQFTLNPDNLSGSATMNGFRLYGQAGGNGATQGFQFEHVRFAGGDRGDANAKIAKFGTLIKIAGSVNASETVMLNCTIRGMKTLLDLGENAEAVNHYFVATSAEAMFGDVFKVSGGSSINVYGGSWTMMSEAVSYFLAIRPASVAIAGTHTFTGGRLELNQNLNSPFNDYSNLLLIDATLQPTAPGSSAPVIAFKSWNSYPTVGAARDTIKIDAALPAKITFDGCAIGDVLGTQRHQVSVVTSLSSLHTTYKDQPTAELDFMNGQAVPFDNVSFGATNAYARVSARNCINTIDYDLTSNGFGSLKRGRVRPLKTVEVGFQWPDTGDNTTLSIRLPKGSILHAVAFRKAANAGTATAGYQLAVTDGAANTYATSTIAAQNVEHKAGATDLNIYLDDAVGYASGVSADQDVFLIATAGHLGSSQAVQFVPGDYFRVSYY